MEVKLKERLLGNGLYRMIRRILYKPVIIESPVIAPKRTITDLAFHELPKPYRYEICRRSTLETERKVAQALAMARWRAHRYL